ncbi:MAG: FKBP-type peptidyl-prolyl cis-trans isomerase [Opitutaceae bacterium]
MSLRLCAFARVYFSLIGLKLDLRPSIPPVPSLFTIHSSPFLKSLLPVLLIGGFLAVLVFAARCSQRAMHDYETRQTSGIEDGSASSSINSAPNDLAENERIAAAFPDTLLSTTAMRFKILDPGSGRPPIAGNEVRFFYTARLLDGTPLAAIRAPAEPATLVLLAQGTPRGLPAPVRGLDLALMEMRPGEKRLVILPSSLAFGPGGLPPQIPPRAPIVFELNLLH